MPRDIETRTAQLAELRLTDLNGSPQVSGRAIVFDQLSCDMGGWVERFAPDSVELDPDLLVLFDHDSAMVLGRTTSGTASAAVDAQGVTFTADPPETTWFADLRVSMQRGDIHQCSFSFIPEEDEILFDRELGTIVRTVTKAQVLELSVVSMPAYPQTSSTTRELVAEARAKAIAGRIGELRAGRVLSTANMQALDDANEMLEQASELIEGVLASDPNWVDDNDDGEGDEPTENDTTPTRAAPVGTEGDAPSTTPGQVFIPGIGFRTHTETNGG